jgi:gamma-glutamylcyclotransferase
MHYFAYGSNMDLDQTKDRIGEFKIIGITILDGYRLKFNKRSKDGSGKANIVPESESKVEGVLFDLTEEQMKEMDDCEQGYSRKTIPLNDDSLNAVTYVANPDTIDEKLRPTRDYLDKIINAAKKLGVSEAYQQMLKVFPVRN